MKMRGMMVAVLAMMTAVPMTMAEEIKMDFDGGKKTFAAGADGPFALAKARLSAGKTEVKAGVCAAGENEALRQEAVDHSIEGVLLQARFAGEQRLARDLRNLLAKGTAEQKREFVSWKSGAYRFPAEIAPRTDNKGVCRWVTSTLCEWTCDFGDSGESAQNCKNECRKILVEACD